MFLLTSVRVRVCEVAAGSAEAATASPMSADLRILQDSARLVGPSASLRMHGAVKKIIMRTCILRSLGGRSWLNRSEFYT